MPFAPAERPTGMNGIICCKEDQQITAAISAAVSHSNSVIISQVNHPASTLQKH